MVKEKEAHIEQLMQEFEIERTELAKVTTEREAVRAIEIIGLKNESSLRIIIFGLLRQNILEFHKHLCLCLRLSKLSIELLFSIEGKRVEGGSLFLEHIFV